MPEPQREAALAEAGRRGGGAPSRPSRRPPKLLVWRGIVLSTWAGAQGGLGALELGQARQGLPGEGHRPRSQGALQGSAYTSLGSLYYQVPGWPMGFGDDDKADQLLQQALALNPAGDRPQVLLG